MPNTFTDNPQAGHTLATDQPNIEANFLYLANTLGTSNSNNGDHQISIGGTDAVTFEGRHRQVCFNNRHGSAPTVAGIGDGTNALLYADNGNVFFGSVTGAGAFQLTTYNSGANFGGHATIGGSINAGWTFLPGGLILQYGTVQSPGGGGTVQFPIAFPNAPLSITFSIVTDTGGLHGYWINKDLPNRFTQTQFIYTGDTASASITNMFWMCIGY
jgi:hypothetical protein